MSLFCKWKAWRDSKKLPAYVKQYDVERSGRFAPWGVFCAISGRIIVGGMYEREGAERIARQWGFRLVEADHD